MFFNDLLYDWTLSMRTILRPSFPRHYYSHSRWVPVPSQQPNPEDDMKRVTSPGDSLSANEIEQAAPAIRARQGDDTIFNRISVSQPEKSVALQWQAGRTPRRSALISFRAAKQTHHATYFNASSLYPTETVLAAGHKAAALITASLVYSDHFSLQISPSM